MLNRLLSANCEQANNNCSVGILNKFPKCNNNLPVQYLIAGIPPPNETSDGVLPATTQQLWPTLVVHSRSAIAYRLLLSLDRN